MTGKSALSIRPESLGPALMWIVLGGAFLAAYLPAINSLVRAWASSDDHSHGFAILPLALYILWQKREALRTLPLQGSWIGLMVAFVSLFFYLVAVKGEMQTITSASMLLFIWGSVIYLFGFEMFRACLFPLLILFLMIPVPSQFIAVLTIPLQLLVTRASVWMATLIGIPIFREGNVIQLTNGTFEVVQACSGLRSIMAMLTLGAVLAYFTLRSNLMRSMLLLLAIPIAIVVNIFRVFVLVAVFHFMSVDLSRGTAHTVMGVAVFGVALGLFLLISKGFARCER
jgi:exosortase